jgi:hypothetical protein
MKESRAEYRRKDAATEREIAAELARQQAEADARYKAVRAAERAEKAARQVFTRDDVLGAHHVRDELGWHRVVRVNTTSVTVMTPWSWTDRIPITKILGFAPPVDRTTAL